MLFRSDFTVEKLEQLIPEAKYGVDVWYKELNILLPVFSISSTNRVAAFIAQTVHESVGYKVLKENLNYKAAALQKVWPKHFNQSNASAYADNPEAIANKVYANRMGNGDESTGDGYKYCGRGLLQLSGKTNYMKFAQYAGISLEEAPEYVETPRGAVHSASWLWYVKNLNAYADANDFIGMTNRVSGGVFGVNERTKYYERAIKVLC